MIYVKGAEIHVPRGESTSFDIIFGGSPPVDIEDNVLWIDDEIPEDGSVIRFSVKQNTEKLLPIIEKDLEVWNGFVTIPIESIDTNWLPFGEYRWDIRLLFNNVTGRDPNTPIAPHSFFISPHSFFINEVVGNV